LFYRLSTDCNATILRRERACFCTRNRRRPILMCTGFVITPSTRTVRIVKRRSGSTKIFSGEGFCPRNCPLLNGARHESQCFRPIACVKLMHSVIALCSLARLAQMSTPNTLTGKGNTS